MTYRADEEVIQLSLPAYRECREKRICGTALGSAVAFGKLFFLSQGENIPAVPEFSISEEDIEQEIWRCRRAIFSGCNDLYHLKNELLKEGALQGIPVIDAHIEMLKDRYLMKRIEENIRKKQKNSEAMFCLVIDEFEKKFEKQGGVFSQRIVDLRDIKQTILSKLDHIFQREKASIPHSAILVIRELLPSQVATISKGFIKGIITERGGPTSHAALIACSKGFAYISGVDIGILMNHLEEDAIVDAKLGCVFLSPSVSTIKEYQKKKDNETWVSGCFEKRGKFLTKDHCMVTLLANVESREDFSKIETEQADGIGLFRSEFFFLDQEVASLSEERQYELYKEVMDHAKGRSVTFRVFDIGGDKPIREEPNPALGCRGVRFLLQHQDILQRQLRAILRMSSLGVVKLLVPLVSDLEEVYLFKSIIAKTIETLRKEGYVISDSVPFGVMIEVPAMSIMIDYLVKEVDFLSIGTNDLTQYTLAADRIMQKGNSFYLPYHPALLRMIDHVAEVASLKGKPVTICGESTSNLLMVPVFLGLGVWSLSCSVRDIPKVRRMIESTQLIEAQSIAKKALQFATEREVKQFLQLQYGELVSMIEDPC